MSDSLLISVRLHEGWYHGAGSIPSPARMFQALIAGSGLSGPLPKEDIAALEWLEKQPAPIIAAPVTKAGQPVTTYVPNNDLDSKQGDHRRIDKIRTKKSIRPLLFDANVPFVYCWTLSDENRNEMAIGHICELADRVYQLGRTVDAAWASGEVLSDDDVREKLRSHRGPVRYPAVGRGNVECPTPGSLASLMRRHADMSNRFDLTAEGKGQTFRRRSKPKWRMVSYESAPTRVSFDLIDRETSTMGAWPTEQTMILVTAIRDAAVSNLTRTLPAYEAEIQRTLIGRKANGEHAGPPSARVRIIPLPSIGHVMTDQNIRRILIEVPGDCPLRADDVIWAFSGQTLSLHGRTIDLVRSQPHRQLDYYGVTSQASRHWQTVTPIVLSKAVRRRIEPDPKKRQPNDLKDASEKRFEQELASSAIRNALRHAGILANVRSIRVQREPFDQRGTRVEPFAEGTRFSKHCLWHVELEFESLVPGPLVLGDGRFLGLGLMRPLQRVDHVLAFSIDSGLAVNADPIRLSRAFRRAVLSCVGDTSGKRTLSAFFTGHQSDGAPARSDDQPHLGFAFDPAGERLLIIGPELLNRRSVVGHAEEFRVLKQAVSRLLQLRAGDCGLLNLSPARVDRDTDPLFQPSRIWRSATSYSVNRHAKRTTPEASLRMDVVNECQRRGLPKPIVTVLDYKSCRGKSLEGTLELRFNHAVNGPMLLGKTRHFGGGLFVAHQD